MTTDKRPMNILDLTTVDQWSIDMMAFKIVNNSSKGKWTNDYPISILRALSIATSKEEKNIKKVSLKIYLIVVKSK